jgi:hypothetical protein
MTSLFSPILSTQGGMHVVKDAKEEGKEDRGKGSALFFEGRRRSFGVDIKSPGIEK